MRWAVRRWAHYMIAKRGWHREEREIRRVRRERDDMRREIISSAWRFDEIAREDGVPADKIPRRFIEEALDDNRRPS